MPTITDIINAHLVSQKLDFMVDNQGMSTSKKQDLLYDIKDRIKTKWYHRKLLNNETYTTNEMNVHLYNALNRYAKLVLGYDTGRGKIEYERGLDGTERINY